MCWGFDLIDWITNLFESEQPTRINNQVISSSYNKCCDQYSKRLNYKISEQNKQYQRRSISKTKALKLLQKRVNNLELQLANRHQTEDTWRAYL